MTENNDIEDIKDEIKALKDVTESIDRQLDNYREYKTGDDLIEKAVCDNAHAQPPFYGEGKPLGSGHK